MQISKIILISDCLAGVSLSGCSQDASTTAVRGAPDAQAAATPTFIVLYNFGTKAGDPEGLFSPGIGARP